MRAFWKYDLYPFVLSGTVTSINPVSKLVKTKQFGESSFQPVFILPDEEGDRVAERLSELEQEYRWAKTRLEEEYKRKLLATAPFIY
jgi:hypothetical protein